MSGINWYPKVKESFSRPAFAFRLATYILVSVVGLIVLGTILTQFASS